MDVVDTKADKSEGRKRLVDLPWFHGTFKIQRRETASRGRSKGKGSPRCDSPRGKYKLEGRKSKFPEIFQISGEFTWREHYVTAFDGIIMLKRDVIALYGNRNVVSRLSERSSSRSSSFFDKRKLARSSIIESTTWHYRGAAPPFDIGGQRIKIFS